MTSVLITLIAGSLTGALFFKPWTYPLLVLASAGFLGLAWTSGARHTSFGRLLFIGLILCFLGDAIGPYHFTAGSSAFLLAHLFFIAAFIQHGLDKRRAMIGSLFALPASVAVIAHLWPGVTSDYRLLVIAYIAIITPMLALSAGTRPFLLLAAIIFYASDIFLARWKFIGGSYHAYICYPLYYTACTMLALSIQRIRGGTDETGRPAVQIV